MAGGIGAWLYDRSYAAPSQWRPYASPTTAPAAAPSGPVQSAYDAMFGGADDLGGGEYGGNGGGVSSGVSGGVSAGTSQGIGPGTKATFGRGEIGGYIGQAVNAATRGALPGLGMGLGAIGTLGDVEEANANLAARFNLPPINKFEALINNVVPFNLAAKLGFYDPETQYTNAMKGYFQTDPMQNAWTGFDTLDFLDNFDKGPPVGEFDEKGVFGGFAENMDETNDPENNSPGKGIGFDANWGADYDSNNGGGGGGGSSSNASNTGGVDGSDSEDGGW